MNRINRTLLWGALQTILWAANGWCQFGQIDLPAFLADAGTTVESVKTDLSYSEGPVFDKNQNFYFSEQNAGTIWKISPSGTASKWRTNLDTPNGMEMYPDGHLLCCENGKISKVDSTGRVLKYMVQNASYGKLNDLSIGSNGGFFFTNNVNSFFYLSPDSVVTVYSDYSGKSPNGIEWIEEKSILFVNLTGAGEVVRFSVDNQGKVNENSRKKFADVSMPDGLTVDEKYNVYIASYREGRVIVFDSSGTRLGDITITHNGATAMGNACNCIFGGTDNKTLYITGNHGAYKVRLKIPGRKPSATATTATPVISADFQTQKYRLSTKFWNPGSGVLRLSSLSVFESDIRLAFYDPLSRLIHRDVKHLRSGNQLIVQLGENVPSGLNALVLFKENRILWSSPLIVAK